MGSESSKSSDSSNSGKENSELEEMNDLKENKNTIINRVWVVKKSIRLTDENVDITYGFKPLRGFAEHIGLLKYGNSIRGVLIDPKINIFNVKKGWNALPKHWAIILELSNGSYVNIQFGRKGFSLKEFNKEETQLEGENLLNSILETWGKENTPCSFCYLGNAKYEYEKLKAFLKKKKMKKKKVKKDVIRFIIIYHLIIAMILYMKLKRFYLIKIQVIPLNII